MFGQASFMVAATTTLLGSTLGLTRSLRERGDAERVCNMPEDAPSGQPARGSFAPYPHVRGA